jgi:cellulose synthase (UDP-forming)
MALVDNFLELAWPALVTMGIVLALMPLLDPNSFRARALVISVSLALAAHYLVWRVSSTLPPFGLTASFSLGFVFLLVEGAAVCAGMASVFLLVRTRSRSSEVDRHLLDPGRRRRCPLVDVFICTYNEEEAILERTIIGAQSMTYPNFRVWVLDDGKRPWLKELCSTLDCGYITRTDSSHAKAGNINNGLRHVMALDQPPDLLSILDADFVPTPGFLTRTVILMDEGVGVVQTPQHFVNADPIQQNLSAAAVWPDEQRFFFDVVMPSLDAWDGAFCCGTSSVIRIAALQRIGGFPTDSVTEDYLLTLRLKEVGYATVYLNEPLTFGLAPEGLKEYITQRGRWCLGFIQIIRGRSGPFARSALGLRDRLLLILSFLNWSAVYAAKALSFVVPTAFLLFGVVAVTADIHEMMERFLPYFVWNSAALSWLARGRWMVIMSEVCQLIAAPAVLKAVAIGLAKPKGHRFKVTAKGGDRSRGFVEWSMLATYLAALFVTMLAIAWGFFVDFQYAQPKYAALALFWSWYNVILLIVTCVVCIEQPRRRLSDRFETNAQASVTVDGSTKSYRLQDISIGGARVRGEPPAAIGATLSWEIGNCTLPATIVRASPEHFSLRFENSLSTRISIIRHFYAGRYIHPIEQVKPTKLVRAIIGRLLA